jgi:hypothetical protein
MMWNTLDCGHDGADSRRFELQADVIRELGTEQILNFEFSGR